MGGGFITFTSKGKEIIARTGTFNSTYVDLVRTNRFPIQVQNAVERDLWAVKQQFEIGYVKLDHSERQLNSDYMQHLNKQLKTNWYNAPTATEIEKVIQLTSKILSSLKLPEGFAVHTGSLDHLVQLAADTAYKSGITAKGGFPLDGGASEGEGKVEESKFEKLNWSLNQTSTKVIYRHPSPTKDTLSSFINPFI